MDGFYPARIDNEAGMEFNMLTISPHTSPAHVLFFFKWLKKILFLNFKFMIFFYFVLLNIYFLCFKI